MYPDYKNRIHDDLNLNLAILTFMSGPSLISMLS